ncbi:MAG TPA: DUF899 family protein [candidate division Zixibacteria bacterium]|nr:DUF899 family protein [candidate division Zixibacteria bacterium]MDD4918822.1 DUF899 family protein [candidate division Zixibacteria bacterium]HOZ06963.1 DUF899 family protein [candidate division Zixibacteria bacterium]HPC10654.1 DUF899 family protein [candidate division Zixibacteria bacterium]HPI32531.1 DUF899 family protein [candidate division Zixibacteria bacterium]
MITRFGLTTTSQEAEMFATDSATTRRRIEDLRHQLLELRRQVRELRKTVPEEVIGREYVFAGPRGIRITLADLFGDRDELIIIHNMGRACRYCTLWADGLNGLVPHLAGRASLVLVSPDPPEIQQAFAASRGWQFDLWSTGAEFLVDMKMADEKGSPWPGISAFVRRPDGTIVRTAFDYFGPGDDYCAVWHIWDMFPSGAGGWEPREG